MKRIIFLSTLFFIFTLSIIYVGYFITPKPGQSQHIAPSNTQIHNRQSPAENIKIVSNTERITGTSGSSGQLAPVTTGQVGQTNSIDETHEKVLMLNGEEPTPEILRLKEQIIKLLSNEEAPATETVKTLLSSHKGGNVLEVIFLILLDTDLSYEIYDLILKSIPDRKDIIPEIAEYLLNTILSNPGQVSKYFYSHEHDWHFDSIKRENYLEKLMNKCLEQNDIRDMVEFLNDGMKTRIFDYIRNEELEKKEYESDGTYSPLYVTRDKLALINYLSGDIKSERILQGLEETLYTHTSNHSISIPIAGVLLLADNPDINKRLYKFISDPSSDKTVVAEILFKIAEDEDETVIKKYPYLLEALHTVYSNNFLQAISKKELSYSEEHAICRAIYWYANNNKNNEKSLDKIIDIIDSDTNERVRSVGVSALGSYKETPDVQKALAKLKSVVDDPIYPRALKHSALWEINRFHNDETVKWLNALLENPQYAEIHGDIKSTLHEIQRWEDYLRKQQKQEPK